MLSFYSLIQSQELDWIFVNSAHWATSSQVFPFKGIMIITWGSWPFLNHQLKSVTDMLSFILSLLCFDTQPQKKQKKGTQGKHCANAPSNGQMNIVYQCTWVHTKGAKHYSSSSLTFLFLYKWDILILRRTNNYTDSCVQWRKVYRIRIKEIKNSID